MKHLIQFGAALAFFAHSAAGAQEFNLDDVVQAEILPGWQTETGTWRAALHLRLAPHWKTYWRAPGETGIPPFFDLSGSTNIATMNLNWPIPQVFDLNGLQTIGYTTDLVLPMDLAPATAGQPMALVAQINLGVCRDICVPVTLNLAADLSGTGAPDARITAALADQPQAAAKAGLTAVHCTVEPIPDGLRLTAELALPATGARETGVIELADPNIWVSTAQTRRSGDLLTLSAELVNNAGTSFALDRSAVRLTVLGTDRAVELWGCPAG